MRGVHPFTCIPGLKTTTAIILLAEGLAWQTLCITLPARSSWAGLAGSGPCCWRCGFKYRKVTWPFWGELTCHPSKEEWREAFKMLSLNFTIYSKDVYLSWKKASAMIYEFHSKQSCILDSSVVPSFLNPVEFVLYNGELFIHTASLCTESVTVMDRQ